MIGGIEETSASSEARSAPRSYPTGGGRLPPATRWVLSNEHSYREPRIEADGCCGFNRCRPTYQLKAFGNSGLDWLELFLFMLAYKCSICGSKTVLDFLRQKL
jgi:hypothetical protein